jgi:RNA polymerase sigma-70 factor (ECF subfamily)
MRRMSMRHLECAALGVEAPDQCAHDPKPPIANCKPGRSQRSNRGHKTGPEHAPAEDETSLTSDVAVVSALLQTIAALTNHVDASQTLTTFYHDEILGSYAGYAGELNSRSSEQPALGRWAASTRVEVQMNEFGRLLESEIPRLRRYARALTRNTAKADDLVQSSLVRALEKQHLWQPGSNLRAWLFTILHNQHVNDVRQSLRQGSPGPVEDAEPVWRVEPVADASLQLRDLQRAINTLSHEQREVLLLVGLEGMRYEQVAAILDIPVGTVRSRLSRARTTLRLLMDGAKSANDGWRESGEDLAA